MKKNRFSIAVVICVLIFGALSIIIYGCGRSETGENVKSGKAVYYCPMHPTYTSDRPGDCPICNMKLLKREAVAEKSVSHAGHEAGQAVKPSEEKTLEEVCIEHACNMKDCPMMVKTAMKPGERIVCPICGEVMSTETGKVVQISHPASWSSESTGRTVTISQEKQQLIGVRTEPVTKRALTKVVRASGKIAYDPELVVTQEEFIQALTNEDNVKYSPLKDVSDRAKSLTEAVRRKLKLLGMNDEQIAGLADTRKAQTGLYLPGKGEGVWAYISIYEYEIGLVKVGASVELEATAYPGEIFTGKVVSISPVLDPMTRTNQIRVEIANPDDKLKPEMFVSAGIKVDLGEKLAVPEAAVLDTGVRKIVYLSKPDDLLESREIKVGQKGDGYYEVIEGLSEGDIVVTSGNFLIDSESKLKSAAIGESAHQHGQ